MKFAMGADVLSHTEHAANVNSIIDTVRKSLELSDESAQAALQKAKSAVANIG